MSDIIYSNSVLTDARGIPQAPSDIVASLKRIDDRLDLLHLRPSEVEYLDNPNARGTWAIIINWTDHDPRRARIQSGELDPTAAFDYIVTLPMDCPPDQARAYFEKAVKGAAHMPESHTLLDRVRLWNEKQAEKNAAGSRSSDCEIGRQQSQSGFGRERLGGGTVVSSFGGLAKPDEPKSCLSLSGCSKRSGRKPHSAERSRESRSLGVAETSLAAGRLRRRYGVGLHTRRRSRPADRYRARSHMAPDTGRQSVLPHVAQDADVRRAGQISHERFVGLGGRRAGEALPRAQSVDRQLRLRRQVRRR
jgi:hypothetical protein